MNTLMLLFHFALVTTIYRQTSNAAGTADSVTVNANQTAVPPESHLMTSRPTDSITTMESRSSPSASSPVVNHTSTAPYHSSYTVTDPGSPNSTAASPTLTEEAFPVPGSNISSTIQPNSREQTERTSDTNNTSSTETLTSSPTGKSDHTTATDDSISTSEMRTLLDSSTYSTIPTTSTDQAEPTSTDGISSTELFTVSDTSISTRDGTSTLTTMVTKTIPIIATTLVPTVPPGFCLSNPCPSESICVDLYENFTCQCLSGMFFTGSSCITAKVFPGNLHLTNSNFSTQMSDTTSKIFKETAQSISEMMAQVLKDNEGYKESKVISLKQGSVIASLENIFAHSSSITEKDIGEKIDNAIKNNDYPLLNSAKFFATSACDSAPPYCDSNTTSCNFDNGIVSCSCLDEYVPFLFSPRTCIACPIGQKAENGRCVSCPFGYSGFNCSDSALLAVVVISCVLGGLLLFTLLALLIICCRTTSKGHNYGSPYSSPNAAEPLPNQGIPKIPRANTNNHWERPEMEMTENGNTQPMAAREQVPSRRGYYDDLKNFAGRNTSKYSHLVQGQENPYFVHEDEYGK